MSDYSTEGKGGDWLSAAGYYAAPKRASSRPSPKKIDPQDKVGFGKHAELTYEQLERDEPAYADWIVRKYQNHETSFYKMERLARYLIGDY